MLQGELEGVKSESIATPSGGVTTLDSHGRICHQLLHYLAVTNISLYTAANFDHASLLTIPDCWLHPTYLDIGLTSPTTIDKSLYDCIGEVECVLRTRCEQFRSATFFEHSIVAKLPIVHPFCNCVLVNYLSALLKHSIYIKASHSCNFQLCYFLQGLRRVYNSIGSKRGKKLFLMMMCKAAGYNCVDNGTDLYTYN